MLHWLGYTGGVNRHPGKKHSPRNGIGPPPRLENGPTLTEEPETRHHNAAERSSTRVTAESVLARKLT